MLDGTTEATGDIANRQALDRALAIVAFAMDGTILHANANFLALFGYAAREIVGRHHDMFMPADEASVPDYAGFWTSLHDGLIQTAACRRVRKDRSTVWIQAIYTPVLDADGQPYEVVAFATDITAERLRQADYEGQIAAIHKSQAVITFDMDGTVVEANDIFLNAMGYRIDEVEGRHHRMFVEPSYAHGPEYSRFWDDLSQGLHQAAEYRRLGKGGREVWLQATYNPVFDLNGQPFKVVKYATVVTREKLRQADLQGQIASIHKAQCVISFALDGTILDANDNFLAVTGYRLGQIRGRHHSIFVEAATVQTAAYAAFWSALAQGQHQAAEFKRICKDGREIWLQASYNPIFDMNGRPFKVVEYATDVTEERLRQVDHEGQIAAIERSQCVLAFDLDGTILDANDNFLAAFGYRLDEIKGRHHRIFVEPAFAESDAYAEFWQALRAGSSLSRKFKRRGKDDREVWIQASYNPILDLNGKPFRIMKIATDITADVALVADLNDAKQQAEHDLTTGLPNRIRLADFMTNVLAEPEARLAVLYMDLDHFKPINDTFGHHVGDQVLIETASRLHHALAKDHLVARIGGDEFVVAAPNLTDPEIEALCQSLIAIVKAPIRHDNGSLTVSLSIGVAVSPTDAVTSDDLLRHADVALYRSKGRGRGSYSLFSKGIDEKGPTNRHLADDMLHGIKAGEFFLEYQPRFDLRTRKVQSVEAFVRWEHNERGRIEASDFIPLAEESGLIVPLGEWVLRAACQAIEAWPALGISINISPVQFRSTNLIEIVGTVLTETGLAAERLELEITEAVLREEPGRAHAALTALRSLGVRLAIDGCKTGTAALDFLRGFPLDRIKIDRQCIADMAEQSDGPAMVQAVLDLGKTLGLPVTAAGIETAGQFMLLDLGDCSEVQGFLLAPPMSPHAISVLLTQEHARLTEAG